MWWWLLGYSFSTSTSTTGACGLGYLPWGGARGVSPDAVVTFVDTCGLGTDETLDLDNGRGLDVPGTTRVVDGALVFTPDEPLAPGFYRAHVPTRFGTETSFEVGEPGDALELSPGVEAIDLDLNRTCASTFRGFRLKVEITLEEPRAGLLQAHVTTDGNSAGWQTVGVGEDVPPVAFGVDVIDGLHEHCVQARLLDETGAVAWTSEPSCVDPEPCPPPRDSGCATAAASPSWALALLALLRSPRSARSRSPRPASGRSRTPARSSSPPPR